MEILHKSFKNKNPVEMNYKFILLIIVPKLELEDLRDYKDLPVMSYKPSSV